MPFDRVEDLRQALVRIRLLSPAEVQDAVERAGSAGRTVSGLLDWLEQKGILTPYQSSRLQKGDTDGLVLGHYKLLYRNAAGSFARVYRAVDVRSGKMLGLKVLRQRWATDPQAVKEFQAEAELGRSLKHENIVPIYDIGKDGDQHFFSMEFVEGGNLRDFINIRKKLSPREAIKCMLDVAEGLGYAGKRGVLHRDLKLTNVLMSTQGVAKLVDFGLSGGPNIGKRGDGEAVQRALDYATLEKGTNAPRNDPRSDLFFVGVMLYELLTGHPPLAPTRDRTERGQFSRYQNIRPLRTVEPTLPRTVTNLVDRLLQLNPILRYQTPDEAARDLRGALVELDNLPTPAPSPADSAEPDDTPPRSRAKGSTSSVDVDDVPRERRRAQVENKKTLLCIEPRLKQQDLLRDYFSRHGFRVLVMSDMQRGLSRLESNPPDVLVIMAEGVGEAAQQGFRTAARLRAGTPQVTMLVLSAEQADWKAALPESHQARVLVLPITLRDLRLTVAKALQGESTDIEEPQGTSTAPNTAATLSEFANGNGDSDPLAPALLDTTNGDATASPLAISDDPLLSPLLSTPPSLPAPGDSTPIDDDE